MLGVSMKAGRMTHLTLIRALVGVRVWRGRLLLGGSLHWGGGAWGGLLSLGCILLHALHCVLQLAELVVELLLLLLQHRPEFLTLCTRGLPRLRTVG